MSSLLKATKREGFKKSDLTDLRSAGKLPAVVYGYKVENTSISVDEIDLVKTIREVGRNGVIDLEIEGKKQKVVLSDYQSDFLKDEIIHADFLAINMSSELDVDVTVHLTGEAAGTNEGGVVQTTLHELSVTAKPSDIPEYIEVDISKLEIGDTISVGDIRDSYKVTINHEDDEAIASVLAPRVEEEPEEDAGEDQEEPERVGEDQEEQEEQSAE